MLRSITKQQVIILSMAGIIVYLMRAQILMSIIFVYAYVTNSPNAEKAIGEYYHQRANENSKLAAIHFQRSLHRYSVALPVAPKDQRKWIEYFIGTHYECGRGVDEDLYVARQWYQQATKNGLAMGEDSLKRITKAIEMAAQRKDAHRDS